MATKRMTLERLAVLTQREFKSLRGEIHNVRRDTESLRGEIRDLRRDTERGFQTVADALELIRRDFAEMKRAFSLITHSMNTDITELKRRVERLERKVGLAK